MTDLKAWDRWEKEWIKTAKAAVRDLHAEVIGALFDKLVENSPIYSGFYGANHKIVWEGNGSFATFPTKQPSKRGALLGQIEVNRAQQKTKLSSQSMPVVVKVGTAVDYALNMEDPTGGTVAAKTGNRPVYLNSAMQTKLEFETD